MVVLRTHIFHSITLSSLPLTGKSITFPPQVAAGESVRKVIPQSMNGFVHKQACQLFVSPSDTCIPGFEQLLTRVGKS